MKSFRKLFVIVVICMAVITVAANLILIHNNEGDEGRPYRVEAERIAYGLEHGEKPDISGCTYITGVEKLGDKTAEEDFFNSESDYLVISINGDLYRFDYTTRTDNEIYGMLVCLNVSIGIVFLFVIIVLLYIRSRILVPFESISNMPEQLAKGNITIPLKAQKSGFFGSIGPWL